MIIGVRRRSGPRSTVHFIGQPVLQAMKSWWALLASRRTAKNIQIALLLRNVLDVRRALLPALYEGFIQRK